MNHVREKNQETHRQSAPPAGARRPPRELNPLEDLTAYVQEYARQKPQAVAIACLGVGFLLGWKLKLW